MASLIEKSEQALDLNGPPVQSKKRIAIWPFVLGVVLVGAALFAWLPSNQLCPKDVAGEAKQDDQLIKQYQSQAQHNPRDLEALIMLNNLYIGRGQYEQKIPIIKQIVELEPHSLDWQMTLARVHDLAGQTAVAEQVYKQILRKDPQNFEALFELAKLRQLQGDAANAKLYFQKAEQATTSPSLRAQVRDEIRQLSQ